MKRANKKDYAATTSTPLMLVILSPEEQRNRCSKKREDAAAADVMKRIGESVWVMLRNMRDQCLCPTTTSARKRKSRANGEERYDHFVLSSTTSGTQVLGSVVIVTCCHSFQLTLSFLHLPVDDAVVRITELSSVPQHSSLFLSLPADLMDLFRGLAQVARR